jgi:hypothetical protein
MGYIAQPVSSLRPNILRLSDCVLTDATTQMFARLAVAQMKLDTNPITAMPVGLTSCPPLPNSRSSESRD